MTDDDLTDLLRLAEAATPTPWENVKHATAGPGIYTRLGQLVSNDYMDPADDTEESDRG